MHWGERANKVGAGNQVLGGSGGQCAITPPLSDKRDETPGGQATLPLRPSGLKTLPTLRS